ncbi:MAG: glycerophosphodiester phosphodiesterase [Sedimentisphaeraceae bacterium JB056]
MINKISLFFVMVFIMAVNCNSSIVAHRGYSSKAPENTLSAVKKAWEYDIDAVEIDIHLTSDNKVVVIHDSNTERTCGVKHTIKETDSKTLRELDFGSWFSGEYAGEKIPYLSEVIDVIPQEKKLFIEIKCGSEVVPFLKKVIEDSGRSEDLRIISFDCDALTEAKKVMPDVPMYWLISGKKDKESGKVLPYNQESIDVVKHRGLDGLDVQFSVLTKEFVDSVHAAGLEIFVWTVDFMDDVRRMHGLGVDGITTNYPYEAYKELKK